MPTIRRNLFRYLYPQVCLNVYQKTLAEKIERHVIFNNDFFT